MGEPARILQGPWAKAPSLADRTADVFSRVLPTAWPGYAPPEHLRQLVEAIERSVTETVEIAFSVPVRHGKTTLLVAAVVWLLIVKPDAQIATAADAAHRLAPARDAMLTLFNFLSSLAGSGTGHAASPEMQEALAATAAAAQG